MKQMAKKASDMYLLTFSATQTASFTLGVDITKLGPDSIVWSRKYCLVIAAFVSIGMGK